MKNIKLALHAFQKKFNCQCRLITVTYRLQFFESGQITIFNIRRQLKRIQADVKAFS